MREESPRYAPEKKKVVPTLNVRLSAGIAGGLLFITLCIWGGTSLLNNLPLTVPAPTNVAQSTQTRTPASTQIFVSSSETSIPETPEFNIGSTMTGNDGATLVYVPAGEFLMGSTAADTLASEDEKPQHPVTLDAFWIDQTEVTNKLFSSFISATGYQTDAEKTGSSYVGDGTNWVQTNGANWQHPNGPSSDISGKEKQPVIHVSWNDAAAYCKWADRRLPTEAEWEKAARGTDGRIYPWGNDTPNNNLLNFNNSNGGTTEVGKYPDGKSIYGAYDMAGNVWEWVEDWYDAYPKNTVSNSEYGTTNRVLRGGSWNYSDYLVRSASRYRINPTFPVNVIGFRCASSR